MGLLFKNLGLKYQVFAAQLILVVVSLGSLASTITLGGLNWHCIDSCHLLYTVSQKKHPQHF